MVCNMGKRNLPDVSTHAQVCGHINQIMTAHVTCHWVCNNQPCECNKLLMFSTLHYLTANRLYKLNKMFTTTAEFTEQFTERGYK